MTLKLQGCAFICAFAALMSACSDNTADAQNNGVPTDQNLLNEVRSNPIQPFAATADDASDIAQLVSFDEAFTEMSDAMEDELLALQEQGKASPEFIYNRKRDNIDSALNMLKALDLKTAQGRYIQGLYADYWQQQKGLLKNKHNTQQQYTSREQVQGLGQLLHAHEQLEHWQQAQ